ncbi:MAG: T9SS type A sorting domain-containing protein [Aureispira sp.]
MRNLILLFSVITLALSVNAQQVPLTPLIEHFTQASCPPCASQNPTMYNTLNTFSPTGSGYVKITYQTSWPGVDPMNAAYPAGPNDRRNIHGVTGVPNATLNGGATAGPNTAVTSTTLTNAAALMSDIDLTASHSYGTGRNINVEIKIKNVGTSTVAAGKRLISAMTEKTVTYPTAPGTNGETAFFYVVRNMYNASTGASATAGTNLPAMNPGDSITYTFTTTAPSYIRVYDEIGFAFFVEDGAGGSVMQSTYSTPIAIATPLDVSTANATFDGPTADYCNTALTPSFSVTNVNAAPITSVEANYTIGNAAPVPVTVSGLNLAQGQSTTITFPATTVGTGTNAITYSVVGLNGGNPDYSAVNNTGLSGSRIVMSSTAVGTSVTTTFDGFAIGTPTVANAIADNPGNIRAYTVNNAISSAVTWNLGGFGNSNGCFRWDFYAIASGSSRLIYEKIDMTQANANTAWLKWSTGYAQYTTEQDRLEVQVSTDCGLTWTTLYNQAGANLSTAPAVNNARFYPNVNQWRADSVSLTPYLTSTDLMIAFKGTSAYGNSLYVDDINTTFEGVVSVNNIEAPTTSFAVFPNPVKNTLNLNFEVADATDLNISIKNALGQTVQQVANQSFVGETTLNVNTSKLAAGVYFVNAVGETGVITKRFVVER